MDTNIVIGFSNQVTKVESSDFNFILPISIMIAKERLLFNRKNNKRIEAIVIDIILFNQPFEVKMFDEIIMSVSTNPIDIDRGKVENGEKMYD